MLNSVCLVGNLVDIVKVETVGKGKDASTVSNFTIAVNRDKDTVSYFDCFAWNGLGDTIAQYFTKGSRIAIQGELVQQRYEDKDGNKRSRVKINVHAFEFAGGETIKEETKSTKKNSRY